jgi:hypothetical protein
MRMQLLGVATILITISPFTVPSSIRAAPTKSDCWVTGDLAGEANPMQVYAALCAAAGPIAREL